MAKIITDQELKEIVGKIIDHPDEHLPEAGVYSRFLSLLAEAICDVCGGDVGTVGYDPGDSLGYTVGIRPNDSLPDDGGIWSAYDTDVTWRDGEEVEES